MATRSGRPEVMAHANIVLAKRALLTELLDQGYLIAEDSGSMLVADREANAWLRFWLTNLATGEKPRIRCRFTLADLGNETRIVGTISLMHAPTRVGRLSESDPETRRPLEDLQFLLDCVAADVESRQRPPAPIHEQPNIARSPKEVNGR